MRKYFFLLLISVALPLAAHGIVYPQLAQEAKNLQDFVPEGWAVIANDSGDLNMDNLPDLAFVIESKDAFQCQDNEDVKHRARVLVVAFYNKEKNSYELKLQADKFIFDAYGLAMKDPFDGLSIARGALHIRFNSFYPSGLGYVNEDKYVFSFHDNQFKLVAFDSDSFHPITGKGERVSMNFETKEANKTIYGSKESVDVLSRDGEIECSKELVLDKNTTVDFFVIPEIHYFENCVSLSSKDIAGF